MGNHVTEQIELVTAEDAARARIVAKLREWAEDNDLPTDRQVGYALAADRIERGECLLT